MNIQISFGLPTQLEACYEMLMHSELGKQYFQYFDPKEILLEGLKQQEIWVAQIDSQPVGFLWFERRGAFGMHTYLHMIAVEEKRRSEGIGTQLLKHFESETFKEDDQIFLLVADFNERAKKLYESLGYLQVGILPGFYHPLINEYLMIKKSL